MYMMRICTNWKNKENEYAQLSESLKVLNPHFVISTQWDSVAGA